MSDTPRGLGWWMASDGRWYPPELHPNRQRPQPQPRPATSAPVRDGDPFLPRSHSIASPGYGATGAGLAGGTDASWHGRARIAVSMGAPVRQNRWTVGFRMVLALPHTVFVTVFSLAIVLVAVAAWITALVLGRLPTTLVHPLEAYLRYTTRVDAYCWLLTDRFPPFDGSAGQYPVAVETRPGRLNRVAVLFRLLSMVPAVIVASVLYSGLAIVAVPIWLVVLVAGRMPRPLFGALAAVLRFQTRTRGFSLMLTAAYPDELFGDASRDVRDMDAWSLVLSKGAKWIVAVFVLLGSTYLVGTDVLDLAVARATSSSPTLSDLETAAAVFDYELGSYQRQLITCARESDSSCVKTAAANAAQQSGTFANTLGGFAFPRQVRPDVVTLRAACRHLAALYEDVAEGRRTFVTSSSQIATAEGAVENDYAAVFHQLS